jgi:hypothetical protein
MRTLSKGNTLLEIRVVLPLATERCKAVAITSELLASMRELQSPDESVQLVDILGSTKEVEVNRAPRGRWYV